MPIFACLFTVICNLVVKFTLCCLVGSIIAFIEDLFSDLKLNLVFNSKIFYKTKIYKMKIVVEKRSRRSYPLTCSSILVLFCTLFLQTLTPSSCSSSASNSGSQQQNEDKNEESIFWKLYSRAKSFLFGAFSFANSAPKNSSRRTSHPHDDDPAEHRIVNDGYHYGVNDIDDGEPERKEENGGWSSSHPHYGHGHAPEDHHHMQLYTLLGGLSFASFLATAVILLTRRNGTSLLRSSAQSQSVANYLLNGNRKEDKLVDKEIEESHDKFVKVPEFVYKLSKIFSPWWYVLQKEEKVGKKDDQGEISFVPVKVTRVPNFLDENE